MDVPKEDALRCTLIMASALALAGCGSKGASSDAAQQQASSITNAQVAAAGGLPGANVKIKGYDAVGCKDKAKSLELIAAQKSDPTTKFVKLMAEGMKDETCRGFGDSLPVKVDHAEGNLTCILPADDPKNKQCFWIANQSL